MQLNATLRHFTLLYATLRYFTPLYATLLYLGRPVNVESIGHHTNLTKVLPPFNT